MLPKHKYLLTYRFAEIVNDLNVEFCNIFVNKYSRTNDQMIQAGRSGKQNIVEGVGQSRISKKGEIKLLGVAEASIEELTADYEDFLRQKKLSIWDKNDPRIRRFRNLGMESTKTYPPKSIKLPDSAEETANLLLTLCHQLTFLLDKQINSLEKKFVEEGGFSENLLRKRLEHRLPK